MRATPLDAKIGHNIKKARIAAHLSLELLGQRLGISRAYLHKIESGGQRIFVSFVDDVATVLDVPLIELIENE